MTLSLLSIDNESPISCDDDLDDGRSLFRMSGLLAGVAEEEEEASGEGLSSSDDAAAVSIIIIALVRFAFNVLVTRSSSCCAAVQ